MALVGIWIVLVVVVPSVLNVAASTAHPVPSRLEFVSKVREADNYTRSEGQKLLAKYYGDHPELVPAGELDLNDFTRRFYAVRQENQRRLLPEMLRFEEQLERQQGLINRYRLLSPAVVMQESLNTIAGTSAERQKEFVAQVRGFMDEWQGFFVPLVFRKVMLKTADYDRVPRFKFQEESTSAVAARVGIGLILLLAPGLLIGAFALARLRRYPLVG
jgi:ABC-2 type transport system permease protein